MFRILLRCSSNPASAAPFEFDPFIRFMCRFVVIRSARLLNMALFVVVLWHVKSRRLKLTVFLAIPSLGVLGLLVIKYGLLSMCATLVVLFKVWPTCRTTESMQPRCTARPQAQAKTTMSELVETLNYVPLFVMNISIMVTATMTRFEAAKPCRTTVRTEIALVLCVV